MLLVDFFINIVTLIRIDETEKSHTSIHNCKLTMSTTPSVVSGRVNLKILFIFCSDY